MIENHENKSFLIADQRVARLIHGMLHEKVPLKKNLVRRRWRIQARAIVIQASHGKVKI